MTIRLSLENDVPPFAFHVDQAYGGPAFAVKPIVVGPHTSNFRLPVEALAAQDAIRQLADGSELAAAVASLLGDPGMGRELGARAREVVLSHQGATQRTIDGIIRVVDTSSAG